MNFKFLLALSMAVFVGLVFAQSTIFLSKTIYNFVKQKSNFGISENKKNTEPQIELGGIDSKVLFDETKLIENFPTNKNSNPNSESIKISEDLSIPKEGKAIAANLESMKLFLYQDGSVIKDFKILGKGRSGTAWETPPGSFKILHKTPNHFSSIGLVWMPYSMQFFGNYFIHGWPYYPDGTPVSPGYSGGCIRLANEDAKEIYEFADLGTKTIILGTTAETINLSQKGNYVKKNQVNFPNISAKSYVVADIDSGEIIFSLDKQVIYPIASITKLMSALISLETINQYRDTFVSSVAVKTHDPKNNLQLNQRIVIGDLMYPLLLSSSNVSAEVLAESVGRDFFIKNMNSKASSVSLFDTSFEDPSGLSPNNISTSLDLFKLTQYIYKYKKYIFNVTRKKEHSNGVNTWFNNHPFKSEPNFLGGKNGYTTAAKHTLISIFELPLGEFVKRNIVIILLQSENTEEDTRNFISHLMNNVYYSYNSD
ncbi:MAG TPA: L,D-transpeptidase family protein [Candidatus Paceibacterota bacterium]|nr:L,D-transpeptidase family protein [Candidatus Paceibacterota bacterium]HMP18929.1 L,D-transpeptidase family protein [Candidatus Paceibacterota bacterium]HMP85092.1 L,D-transpeptidase family protein [Candidatus Paceibacterota bacterium]